MITSVGYRVKSIRGTQFRQWANKVLKEYLLRGFSINQRLLDLENRIDQRFYLQERKIEDLKGQVDLIVSSNFGMIGLFDVTKNWVYFERLAEDK